MIKTILFPSLLAVCFVVTSCSKEQNQENLALQNYASKDLTAQVCDGGDDKDDEQPLPMLQGQISDTEGLPVYQACVDIWTTNGLQLGGTGTDEYGHYYFNTLPSGDFIIRAHKYGSGSAEESVVIGTEPRIINLRIE